jgi:hypothetical protein
LYYYFFFIRMITIGFIHQRCAPKYFSFLYKFFFHHHQWHVDCTHTLYIADASAFFLANENAFNCRASWWWLDATKADVLQTYRLLLSSSSTQIKKQKNQQGIHKGRSLFLDLILLVFTYFPMAWFQLFSRGSGPFGCLMKIKNYCVNTPIQFTQEDDWSEGSFIKWNFFLKKRRISDIVWSKNG